MKRHAISWSDGDNPSYDDGCGFFIVRQMAVAACVALVLMQALGHWRKRPARASDPTRAAEVLSSRVVTPGSQTQAPQIEAMCRCDDGKTRTFVSGPDGRWVRKEVKPTRNALDN